MRIKSIPGAGDDKRKTLTNFDETEPKAVITSNFHPFQRLRLFRGSTSMIA